MPRGQRYNQAFGGRASVLFLGVVLMALATVARLLYLQMVDRDFLAAEGDNRILRTAQISAHRGSLTDRFGEPLAVSTPVDSIWVNPQDFRSATDRLGELARTLELDEAWVARRITSNPDREFVYLKRHLRPDQAARVLSLGVPGVSSIREYGRYYPAGEVAGHVVGFTDIDDVGQEGMELAYDYWLKGEPGVKRIMQDRDGRTIEDVERIRSSRPGKDLATSLDLRLQYLAYRELKAAIASHHARAGSAVVLDVETGEVLAMVNQPAYNPNDRKQFDVARYRNRAVTDIFEPGSSFKPFVVGAALELGTVTPDSIIDTSPGFIQVGSNKIQDTRNLGRIDVTTLLAKSSNVGATKIALELEARDLWGVLSRLGVGQLTGSGFPGESAGMLNEPQHWRPIGQATLAYGYGLSVTALQLAQGYATIGAGGIRRPVSMVALTEPVVGEQAVSRTTAMQLLTMLERVVSPQGTGERASVPGFRIAGKTGTAWKYTVGGYSKDRYLAVFAGLAPASAPRLATVVVIDEPTGGDYHGGDVAAPVFANIMGAGLRLMAVAPDDVKRQPGSILAQLGSQ
jgi:cell division protein FtsI (penicillin-binding protein 3)